MCRLLHSEKWVEPAWHSAKEGSVWKALRAECWVQPPNKTRRTKEVHQNRAQERALSGSSAQRPPLLPGLLASVLQVSRTVDLGL